MALNSEDRDYLVRTILGEHGPDADAEDHAATAHLVLNRMGSDRYADSARDVVLHPGHFPSWANNSREMLAIKPTSAAYKKVAEAVDGASSGDIQDSSGGSTERQSIKSETVFTPTKKLAEAQGVAPKPPPNEMDDLIEAIRRGEKAGVTSPIPPSLNSSQAGSPGAAQPNEMDELIAAKRASEHGIPQKGKGMWSPQPGAIAPIQLEQTMPSPGSVPFGQRATAVSAPHPETYMGAVARKAGEGGAQTWTGLGQMVSGMPASGIGNVVGGLANTFGSPIGGLEAVAPKITGSQESGQVWPMMVPFLGGSRMLGKVQEKFKPSVQALDTAIQAIGKDNIAAGVARLKANPELRPIDVWPELRDLMQGISTDISQPKAMSILRTSVNESKKRLATATTRYADEAMGPTPNVKIEKDRLAAAAENAGRSMINPAVRAATPVDMQKTIALIDKKLTPAVAQDVNVTRGFVDPNAFSTIPGQAGARPITPSTMQQRMAQIRADLTDGQNVLSDPKRLHELQAELRREAEDLMSSATGADRVIGRHLYEVRQSIVDAIDASAGNKYKPGLEAYRDAKDVERFYERGRSVLKQGGDEDRIEYWEHHWKSATDAEKDAARLGARVAVDQEIQRARNAMPGAKIPDAQFVRSRFELMFGKAETDKLARNLADAKDISESNRKLFEGSETARRLAAQARTKPAEVKPFQQNVREGMISTLPAVGEALVAAGAGGPIPAGLGAAAYALGGAKTAFQTISRGLDRRMNVLLSRSASSTGPEREKFILALQGRAFPVQFGGTTQTGSFSRLGGMTRSQIQKLNYRMSIPGRQSLIAGSPITRLLGGP